MYQCMSDDYFKLLARVCNRTRPLIALKGVASFFFISFLFFIFFSGWGTRKASIFKRKEERGSESNLSDRATSVP